MEKSIIINNEIGVKELRTLHDLSDLNRALTYDEFLEIVGVYNKVIERLKVEAEKQGIEV